MATNGNVAYQEPNAAPASIDYNNASAANNDLSKDEVGWYFVEQYYTTLSKSPEKLHLFYGKRSQFVAGSEAEVANVSVGRTDINERIKQLGFNDSKVRVSNVDSQACFEGILIQVIGEVSTKKEDGQPGEPKKFCQTFVLAQQPSGYFVLNDILRYIVEEGEETGEAADESAAEVTEAAPAEVEAPAVEAPKEDTAELDTKVVDEKLEEAVEAPVNGTAAETAEPKAADPEAADANTATEELAEEDAQEPEKPQDPAPTPAVKAAPVEAAPSEPAMPPKPMTWASRIAATAGPRPVVPLPKTATPPAQNQNKAPAPAAAPAAAAPAQASAPAPAAEAPAKDNAGWQTAGDSKRQNRPQSISAAPNDKEGTHGYVKYVTDKVQEADLKKSLEAHGELAYFDINRQKNCAFVEYKGHDGLQAALAANPHTVNGEQIIVEQRRPKSTAYGGAGYGNAGRGGAQRGRGGAGQGNARGNFSGQNRGARGAARGRGPAQATNA